MRVCTPPNTTGIEQYVLDTTFLEQAIDRTNTQFSHLIQTTSQHIRGDMRRQRIHDAIDDVTSSAEVLEDLLPSLRNVDLEQPDNLIIPKLHPLEVSIKRARRVLKREQDRPRLRQSIEKTMLEIQKGILSYVRSRFSATSHFHGKRSHLDCTCSSNIVIIPNNEG